MKKCGRLNSFYHSSELKFSSKPSLKLPENLHSSTEFGRFEAIRIEVDADSSLVT